VKNWQPTSIWGVILEMVGCFICTGSPVGLQRLTAVGWQREEQRNVWICEQGRVLC
jgi:hypothetical protein